MTKMITLRCGGCGSALTFEIESWANTPERAYCDERCRHRTRAHSRQDAAQA